MSRSKGSEEIRTSRYATLLFTLAVLSLFGVSLFYYGKSLAENRRWIANLTDYSETRLDESTFNIILDRDQLLDSPLLSLVVDEKRPGEIGLRLESCEHRPPGKPTTDAEKKRSAAFALLCDSPYGEIIRTDVDAWNAAYHFVAVRDNRSQNDICEDDPSSDRESTVYLRPGCKPPHWRISRAIGDARGGDVAAVPLLATAAPRQEQFGLLLATDEGSVYQSDWAMVDTLADAAAAFQLDADPITIERGKAVTIQVAARVDRVEITPVGAPDPLTVAIDPGAASTSAAGQGLQVEVRRLCAPASVEQLEDAGDSADDGAPPIEDRDVCKDEPKLRSAGVPFAYAIRIKMAERPRDARPRRHATPVPADAAAQTVRVHLSASPMLLPLAEIRAARVEHRHVLLCQAAERKAERPRRTMAPSIERRILGDCRARRRDGDTDGPKDFALPPVGHILIDKCPLSPDAWVSGCRISWDRKELRRGVPAHERREIEVTLTDAAPDPAPAKTGAKPMVLVDPTTGRISDAAFDLGLVDILGLDRSDYGGLLWVLDQGRSEAARKAHLSISEPMQRAVEAVLPDDDRPCLRRRRGARDDRLCSRLIPGQHTATIVLMDADEQHGAPGEIRAVASWPRPRKHLNLWDLQALEAAHVANSGLAWRQLITGQRPGSTFKLVTAVGAIEAALNEGTTVPLPDGKRADLALLLGGGMPITGDDDHNHVHLLGLGKTQGPSNCYLIDDDQRHPTRYEFNAVVAPVAPKKPGVPSRYRWCVHNAGGASYEHEAEPPDPTGGSGCPPELPAGPGVKQMGLCEAIKRSSNLFFGGVSRLLATADPQHQTTAALEDLARRLSYDHERCRSQTGSDIACGFDITRGLVGVRPDARLRADPIDFDVHWPKVDERKAVEAGFGDAQSATPLAMTTYYASLVTQRLVRPSIVVLDRDENRCPKSRAPGECDPAFPASSRFNDFYALLKDGLRAVVKFAGGTAYGKFAGLPPSVVDRIFAKTGTATYRDRRNPANNQSRIEDLNALWLVGWIEGDGGPGPLGHRLAFACHVSGGISGQLGADFCGPAIREVIGRLAGIAPT